MSDGANLSVRCGELDIRAAVREGSEPGIRVAGAQVRVVVRPQSIQLVPRGAALDADNRFAGVVRFGSYLGTTARYEVAVGDAVFVVDVPDPRPGALLAAGDSVSLAFASASVILVPA